MLLFRIWFKKCIFFIIILKKTLQRPAIAKVYIFVVTSLTCLFIFLGIYNMLAISGALIMQGFKMYSSGNYSAF